MQTLPRRAIGRQDARLRGLSARKAIITALALWAGTAHGQDVLPFKERFPPTTIVNFDGGGKVLEYEMRWRTIAVEGGYVEIRGQCQSACTLVVARIPHSRLCFADFSSLMFHQARLDNDTPAYEATRWMYHSYPPDIRDWLLARGGYEAMPLRDYWVLPAAKLWEMGYRRCD